jgi:hypothetical protein
MPKFRIFLLLSSIFYLLSSFSSPVIASTDPQDATISATATVPTLSETSDHTAPSIPILVRPEDGTITGNNQPDFVWKSSTDTGSNTILYTLYLNGIATYLGISNLGNSSGLGYSAWIDGIETKLRVNIPLPDGNYNWYVTATDPSGNTSTSTSWNLTIDTIAPHLALIDLDTYHNPIIIEGSNFDIDGPKGINFIVQSDPYATTQITLTSAELAIYRLSTICDTSGRCYLSQHLNPGVYSVTILSIDQAGNITVLPTFTITIHQAQLVVTFPGITEPIITIPYTPIAQLPSSLPATVSIVASSRMLPSLIAILLALIIILLLIIVWRRKYNLILLNDQGTPLENTIIYHSIPSLRNRFTKIYLSKRDPISFKLGHSDHGRILIPHLTRYSTLTIRTEKATYILSISAVSKLYTLILG